MYVCLQGSFLYSYSYGIDALDLSSKKVAETSKPAGTKRKKEKKK